MQRCFAMRLPLGLARLGAVHGHFFIDQCEGVELGIEFLNARQQGFGYINRRCLATSVQMQQLICCALRQICGCVVSGHGRVLV